MERKQKFTNIFANCSCEKDCCFTLDRFCHEFDSHYTCIIWNEIEFFGITAETPKDKLDDIFSGDYTNAIKIGSISGYLILCKQILAGGGDPHEICDDIDGDLEYTLSALTDDGEPLDMDPEQDVYYMHEFNMEHDCSDLQLKAAILDNLPGIVFRLLHVAPDIIAFYPEPLEFECDAEEEKRCLTLQNIALLKMDAIESPKSEDVADIIQFAEAYQFSEDEMNIIMRRRYSGSAYPEEAKNRNEYDFYEMSGFEEAGNSRLLYKSV